MEDFHISSVELILEVPQAAVRKGLDPEVPAQESACAKARSALKREREISSASAKGLEFQHDLLPGTK